MQHSHDDDCPKDGYASGPDACAKLIAHRQWQIAAAQAGGIEITRKAIMRSAAISTALEF